VKGSAKAKSKVRPEATMGDL